MQRICIHLFTCTQPTVRQVLVHTLYIRQRLTSLAPESVLGGCQNGEVTDVYVLCVFRTEVQGSTMIMMVAPDFYYKYWSYFYNC